MSYGVYVKKSFLVRIILNHSNLFKGQMMWLFEPDACVLKIEVVHCRSLMMMKYQYNVQKRNTS